VLRARGIEITEERVGHSQLEKADTIAVASTRTEAVIRIIESANRTDRQTWLGPDHRALAKASSARGPQAQGADSHYHQDSSHRTCDHQKRFRLSAFLRRVDAKRENLSQQVS